MRYELIEQAARSYQASLKATDSRLRNSVTLIHEDGSYFLWRNAFYIIVSDNQDLDEKYCCVFTEHYGHHVFSTDDIYSVDMFAASIEPDTNLKFDDFLKSLPSLFGNYYFNEPKDSSNTQYSISYDDKGSIQYIRVASCGSKDYYFKFPSPLKLLVNSNSDQNLTTLFWTEGNIYGSGKSIEEALEDFKNELSFMWHIYVNDGYLNLNDNEDKFRLSMLSNVILNDNRKLNNN